MSRKECFDPAELRAVQTAFNEAVGKLSLGTGPPHELQRRLLAVAILNMGDEGAVATPEVVGRFLAVPVSGVETAENRETV